MYTLIDLSVISVILVQKQNIQLLNEELIFRDFHEKP
jgi:hypothetical protein